MRKTIILSAILAVGTFGVKASSAIKANLENPGLSVSAYQGDDKELTDRWMWTATASVNSNNAQKAIDDDPATRWETRAAQANGQYFIVDMNAVNTVSKIVLDFANSKNDQPRGYEVYMSNDGTDWGSVLASGTGTPEQTVITLSKKTAGRYIKIVQTGTTTGNYWSIHEFRAFGQAAKAKK